MLTNMPLNVLRKEVEQMKCENCPLFESWSNESDSGEACAIFGDAWDSQFQYEDKHGEVIGCYIEKAYINKVEKGIYEHYDEMAKNIDEMVKEIDNGLFS